VTISEQLAWYPSAFARLASETDRLPEVSPGSTALRAEASRLPCTNCGQPRSCYSWLADIRGAERRDTCSRISGSVSPPPNQAISGRGFAKEGREEGREEGRLQGAWTKKRAGC